MLWNNEIQSRRAIQYNTVIWKVIVQSLRWQDKQYLIKLSTRNVRLYIFDWLDDVVLCCSKSWAWRNFCQHPCCAITVVSPRWMQGLQFFTQCCCLTEHSLRHILDWKAAVKPGVPGVVRVSSSGWLTGEMQQTFTNSRDGSSTHWFATRWDNGRHMCIFYLSSPEHFRALPQVWPQSWHCWPVKLQASPCAALGCFLNTLVLPWINHGWFLYYSRDH